MESKIKGNLTAVLLLFLVTSGSFAFLIKEKGLSSLSTYPLVNDSAATGKGPFYNFHNPSKSTVIMNAGMKDDGGRAGEQDGTSNRPATFFYHEADRNNPFWKIARGSSIDSLIALAGMRYDREQ